MDNCIKRNEQSIKSEYEINGKSLKIEQRLLTSNEVDQYQKNHIDITQDPEIFEALLANERADEKTEFNDETLYKIRKATKKINEETKELNYWFISASIKFNFFYGGYMTIDSKEIGDEEIINYIKLLSPEIIVELLENANKLSFTTEVEEIEAK